MTSNFIVLMAVSTKGHTILYTHRAATSPPKMFVKLKRIPAYHFSAVSTTLFIPLPNFAANVLNSDGAKHQSYSCGIVL